MKKLNLFICFVGFSSALFLTSTARGISMNFGGTMRTQAAFLSNLAQNTPGSMSSTDFIETRVLLDPNLVVDDHFSVKSEWNALTSPNLAPNSLGQNGGVGGYIYGDPNAKGLNLDRVWLEWTSDFGVVRVGRMPISWGYGLIYDAGNGVWDNWQSTFDRLEYRLHLGHVIGAIAYSKPRKLSVEAESNDAEFYTAFLQYDNPDQDVEAGVLYEKQVRAVGQEQDYVGAGAATNANNPFVLPAGYQNPYPLSANTPYPRTNNLLDIYVRKTFGYFTMGGEIGWVTGNAFDYNHDGNPDDLNAFAATMNVAFDYHKIKIFNEFLFASGDANLNNSLRGFVLLNRNRSPGFIFGQQIIGMYSGNAVNLGSPVIYGNQGSFSGVYYFRPGFRVDWSPSWASGLEAIWARKAAVQLGEDAGLVTEFDLGTDYSVYKNFDVGVTLGLCLPGNGIPVALGAGHKPIFGARSTASLKF